METTRSSEVLRYMRDVLGKRTSVTEEEGAESGFTLIELMVVLLIMAILLAIAIPTFLGVKSGAQDRAAQSNLTTALTSAKAAYANAQSYGSATGSTSITSTLTSQEPEMTFNTTSTGAVGTISLAVFDSGQTLMLVAYSQANSGTCWGAADNESGGPSTTLLASGVTYSSWGATSNSCTPLATAHISSVWSTSYPSSKLTGSAA
jgi:type IV pilus assembly protein PilA